jgi:hypothetical protein
VAFLTERHVSSSLLAGNVNAESWALSPIPEVTEQISYNKAVSSVVLKRQENRTPWEVPEARATAN